MEIDSAQPAHVPVSEDLLDTFGNHAVRNADVRYLFLAEGLIPTAGMPTLRQRSGQAPPKTAADRPASVVVAQRWASLTHSSKTATSGANVVAAHEESSRHFV